MPFFEEFEKTSQESFELEVFEHFVLYNYTFIPSKVEIENLSGRSVGPLALVGGSPVDSHSGLITVPLGSISKTLRSSAIR